MIADIIFTWIAAGLTLAIFSFLYKDNPFYKLAEHIYVGSSAAYNFIWFWFFMFRPTFLEPFFKGTGPALERYLLILPVILGILMLTRIVPKWSWLSRWPIAFSIGIGAGIGLYSVIIGWLLPQLKATLLPLYVPVYQNGVIDIWRTFWASLNNIIFVVAVLTTLTYFYFSSPQKGFLGKTSRIGITFIMIGFGAKFGYDVMARLSLLIGRLYFLLHDWLRII